MWGRGVALKRDVYVAVAGWSAPTATTVSALSSEYSEVCRHTKMRPRPRFSEQLQEEGVPKRGRYAPKVRSASLSITMASMKRHGAMLHHRSAALALAPALAPAALALAPAPAIAIARARALVVAP